MTIRTMILILAASALIIVSGNEVSAAGARTLFTHASRGTIVSIDDNTLVLAHQKNGKTELLQFLLTSATVRKGNLPVGGGASVHYRIENGRQLATSIQAHPSKRKEP